MGQSWSTAETERESNSLEKQYRTVHNETTVFERTSLKKNLALIDNSAEKLLEVLGIQEAPGSKVLLRMAHNLTNNQLQKYILVAIGWFDGRLAGPEGVGEYEWRKLLFQAASSSNVGGEYYISFDDLRDLIYVLISAFDWDPQDFNQSTIELLELKDIGSQILSEVKSPAIQFDQFNTRILDKYPYLLNSLSNIWDRLLYDKESMSSPSAEKSQRVPLSKPINLERSQVAILYAVLGHRILTSIRLFQGTTDGFAMRALEVGVTKWPSPSVMIVKGTQPKHYEKSWASKHKEIDQIVPRAYDIPLKAAKQVTFALFVDEPWKVSYKQCFGSLNGLIIQLEPEINVWKLDPGKIFLTPSKGFGAGLEHPPKINERTKNILLMVDSAMEHAVFRNNSDRHDQFEYRMFVKQVEVIGCGTKTDLERQRKAWEWEEKESQRRKNINVHEDRAILEMAGIIGQYGMD